MFNGQLGVAYQFYSSKLIKRDFQELTVMMEKLERSQEMEVAERMKLETEIRAKQEEVQRIQSEVEIKDAEARRLQEEVEAARYCI